MTGGVPTKESVHEGSRGKKSTVELRVELRVEKSLLYSSKGTVYGSIVGY